jgi:hypothetical protein
MAAMSDYLEDALVNAVFRNTSYTSPATVYAALFTSDPTDANVGLEVTGGGYARQSVAFDAPSNGAIDNTSDITFPTASASWGVVTHMGIFNAATSGNLLVHGQLTAPKTVGSGDIFKFLAADIDIAFQ